MNIDPMTCNPKLRERIQKAEQSNATNYRDQIKAAQNCANEKAACNKRVDRVVRAQSEHNQRGAGQDRSVEESPSGVRYSILIVSYRKRLLDSHDNLRTTHKALVDRITERYGFQSDSDPRLQWNYDQVQTKGPVGTHVLISL